MSPHLTPAERHDHPAHAGTAITLDRDHGIVQRYRARIAARRRARLISRRNRRAIARWLRRTAAHTQPLHPLARRRETLLHHRVAAVRADLLEIAAMLERAHDPDPASVAALHDLLANGCDSPLYDAGSRLRATGDVGRRAFRTHGKQDPDRAGHGSPAMRSERHPSTEVRSHAPANRDKTREMSPRPSLPNGPRPRHPC
jgi:hypothetical protein